MALPKVSSTVHTYKTLDKKIIHFRAYNLGDENALQEAKESGNEDVKVQTILDVLQGLVINKVDITKLPTFEVEHLLLSTRIVSVGNTSNVKIKCEGCGKHHPVELDLSKVYLTDTRPKSNVIEVGKDEVTGETVSVIMKYPSFGALRTMHNAGNKNFIRLCVESVQSGDSFFDFDDVSDEEIDEWLMSLSKDKIKGVYDFINNIPKLRLDVKFTCKCEKENELTIDDFESFFT